MECFPSLLLEQTRLNSPGSTKKTYHISLAVGGSNLSFQPGDSLAICPSNDPVKIDLILQWLGVPYNQEIIDPKTQLPTSIGAFLETRANLSKVTSKLKAALAVDASEIEVEDALNLSSPQTLTPQELAGYLLPLLPRFYSIASSRHVHPNEVHLLVAALEYNVGDSLRYGAGSYFLCQLAKPLHTHIPIYVQPAKNFHLPPSPDAPIILIGPGTGVAPFRAFLQERLALKHPGKNWLFFGERNRSTDFYYEDFWHELAHQGRLDLDTAFSRDTAEKQYVQHRLLAAKQKIWEWIKQGAYLYVCGDATKMAKEVESTFVQIFMSEGKLNEAEARAFLKNLRHTGHYLADVY